MKTLLKHQNFKKIKFCILNFVDLTLKSADCSTHTSGDISLPGIEGGDGFVEGHHDCPGGGGLWSVEVKDAILKVIENKVSLI